jgi:hypothetical protein
VNFWRSPFIEIKNSEILILNHQNYCKLAVEQVHRRANHCNQIKVDQFTSDQVHRREHYHKKKSPLTIHRKFSLQLSNSPQKNQNYGKSCPVRQFTAGKIHRKKKYCFNFYISRGEIFAVNLLCGE